MKETTDKDRSRTKHRVTMRPNRDAWWHRPGGATDISRGPASLRAPPPRLPPEGSCAPEGCRNRFSLPALTAFLAPLQGALPLFTASGGGARRLAGHPANILAPPGAGQLLSAFHSAGKGEGPRRYLPLALALFASGHLALAQSLSWIPTDDGRRTKLPTPVSTRAGFRLLNPGETSVTFTNVLSEAKASENQIRLNGSGVALGDVNGDGRPDLYFCGLESSNALFLNLGNCHFAPSLDSPEIACARDYSTGATFADVDGDGDLDLLVNGIGTGTRLFLNDGAGRFRERNDSGLRRQSGATTLALADVDGDGDLDLYVANYRTTTVRTTGFALLKKGERLMVREEDRDQLEITAEGRVLEQGEPDVLYLNDGAGHFTAVSWTDGRFLDEDGRPLTRPPLDWGLTAVFHDLNGDGAPDLYVCNDFHSTDKIWINDGHGKFRAIDRLALRNTSTFSMAVDFADLDHDGWDDIFVSDMLSPRHARRLMQLAASDSYAVAVGRFDDRPQFDRNTIQLNRGDGTFAEIAHYCGLEASDWTWSNVFLDVDLDGQPDVLCATGHLFDTQDLDAEARIQAAGPWRKERIREKLLRFPKLMQEKVAFRNRGDLTFEPAGERWGFNQIGVAHGMALADLDNDGDLDLVVNNLNQAAGIYRNEAAAPRIAVRLKGKSPNTQGIGAQIQVLGGPGPQSQEVRAGGRYLAGDDPIRVFAAGHATNQLRIEVTWQNGHRSVVPNAQANWIYELEETKAAAVQSPKSKVPSPKSEDHGPRTTDDEPSNHVSRFTFHGTALFKDVSRLLGHKHPEDVFDDFARQPLLPRKLSQLGPGVAWFDYDGDGWDDLAIGSGAGGALAVLRNDGRGGFVRVNGSVLQQRMSSDLTGIVGFTPAPGVRLVIAGRSGYESPTPGPMALLFDAKRDLLDRSFATSPAMSGPLALSDIDGDGDLDLFVGGRCLPGQWPAPASSSVFLNDGGGFRVDAGWSKAFAGVGLISGAAFADLDGDGWDDLLLALEWGPIRLFRNAGNRFVEVTAAAGLEPFVGWWNGVATGDFDGDGELDIVASNWGWNTTYQSAREGQETAARLRSGTRLTAASARMPAIYYGDVDGNSTLDLFEVQFEREFRALMPVRSRRAMADGVPLMLERFPSFASFNTATFEQLVPETNRLQGPLLAPWLATTVFLNRSHKFVPVILPKEAQFAPAFGVCAADFDGDSHDDIFLSQNFFEMQPTMPRLDAGRGLLLKGDGAGGFAAMPGQVSGLRVFGEGRGTAVADYDGDGRLDLAVAQNGADTKLFRGVSGRPGLRIRLQGPPNNPQAVGAIVRLIGEKTAGPARCIQAGNGYWSQDSPVVVLGWPSRSSKLRVRWPGGRVTESPVPANAAEVSVDLSGSIRTLKP